MQSLSGLIAIRDAARKPHRHREFDTMRTSSRVGTRQTDLRRCVWPLKSFAMLTIFKILSLLLDVAFMILLVHVIMSWLISFQVLNLRQPLVASVWDGLTRLLEPIYQPIRRMLPNTGALDLAPLVAFIIIIILRDILLPDLARAFI